MLLFSGIQRNRFTRNHCSGVVGHCVKCGRRRASVWRLAPTYQLLVDFIAPAIAPRPIRGVVAVLHRHAAGTSEITIAVLPCARFSMEGTAGCVSLVQFVPNDQPAIAQQILNCNLSSPVRKPLQDIPGQIFSMQLLLRAGSELSTSAVPSLESLKALPVTALQQALSSSDIDQRGILEKADLAACVHDNFHRLPMAVRADVSALVEAPKKDLVRTDVLQALGARISRLQSDEQYSVRLFQVHLLSISGPDATHEASNLHRNNTDAYTISPPLTSTLQN